MAYAITFPSVPRVTPVGTERYRVLALLQALDVGTTWFILNRYTERAEGNPVVASLIAGSGLTVAMVTLLVVKLAVVQVLYEKRTGVNLISGLYGLVIVNNILALALTIL